MENITYEEFIQNILDTRGRFACGDEYHERHHIIPKSCGGTNDDENLIDLFAREHYEAHRLLVLENPENEKLVYAWWCMSTAKGKHLDDKYKLTSEEYEEVKIRFSKSITGENNPMFGKSRSKETKMKLSELRKGKFIGEDNPFYGKKHTDETKKKISASNSRGNSARARKVIRLFDLKVYDCMKDSAEDNDVCRTTITKRCNERKDFMYYDEWLESQNELEGSDELQVI